MQFAGTEHSLAGHPFFLWSERVVAAIFTIEYVVRWINYKEKIWKYPFSPMAIIDVLAIIPFYVGFFIDLRYLRLVRTLRILRLLKIYRYNTALQSFIKSYHAVKNELGVLLIVIAILIFFSATAVYECERYAQPEVFAKYSDAIWWSVVSLTTVGYGDKFPITESGRIVTAITLIFGLGVFGTFLSLIGSAFIQTMQENSSICILPRTQNKLIEICKNKQYPEDKELIQGLIDQAVHEHFKN